MNRFQLKIHNDIVASLTAIDVLGIPWQKKGSCYVGLAYEYFNMECEEEGFDLLTQIPLSYFETDMREELKNPEFLEVTLSLIELVSESDFLDKQELNELMKVFRGNCNA